ncbi:CoA transferase [uncultured Microbacterium sp.]|uniref:CoA transferase n=1 Tax=uncultured Microbacterium sp. TaxID=191216 RepID=UPI0028DBD952|nr:CoA transferase [uncultured Microbacterium sp.]
MTRTLLVRLLRELGIPSPELPPVPDVPLPSRLSTGSLAWTAVAVAACAAGVDLRTLDPDRIAAAYRSDRLLRLDGSAPDVWSPLSGFWRTTDGWVRTHANYPHHAQRLRTALQLSPSATADDVSRAFARSRRDEVIERIASLGGLAVPVLSEDRAADTALRATPLLAVHHDAGTGSRTPSAAARRPLHGGRPLEGRRVLDLTRVIAGPVATRTLALWGADVLRIDPPGLAEPEWQHFDTGHGKRSAVLDAHDPRFHELLSNADAIVLGYRPSSLAHLGLDIPSLSERHPHLVIAQLSAWGLDHPERAGFDSLVQAESGIAMVESPDGDRPGALPAQALDHSAGYLLAAAVCTTLDRRDVQGGSWTVHTSLRRIAAELLGMERRTEAEPSTASDLAAHAAHFAVNGREVVTAAPALPAYAFGAPRPFAGDAPSW